MISLDIFSGLSSFLLAWKPWSLCASNDWATMESKDPAPLEAPIRDPQTLKSRILFQRTIIRENHTKMYETWIFNFLLKVKIL